MRVLRAWASPLEQQAGWGIARQLFAPVAERSGVGRGCSWRRDAGPAVYDPDPGAVRRPAGDAVHAAAYGLTWLACGARRALADRAGRRRRALGRRRRRCGGWSS